MVLLSAMNFVLPCMVIDSKSPYYYDEDQPHAPKVLFLPSPDDAAVLDEVGSVVSILFWKIINLMGEKFRNIFDH